MAHGATVNPVDAVSEPPKVTVSVYSPADNMPMGMVESSSPMAGMAWVVKAMPHSKPSMRLSGPSTSAMLSKHVDEVV